MDRVLTKTNPQLFDKAVLPIQKTLAESFPWLDFAFGICETLTSMKGSKKFVSANFYQGGDSYLQIMPCEELGNFAFFTLRDPQEISSNNRNLILSPFSLIIWYNMNNVSIPIDERNTEQIKGQILGVLNNLRHLNFQITKIYEKPQNIFSDYTYDFKQNQYLMSPYAGLRIDGMIGATIPCMSYRQNMGDSFSNSFQNSFDK